MTRVDFYDGSARYPDDPLAVAATLTAKASQSGAAALVLATDAGQARALDERLWDMGETIFVPHALADDPDAAVAVVLIASPGQPAPSRPVVINLRPDPVAFDCQRVVEIIPNDEPGRVVARDRWRAYLARGLKPSRIDLPAR